MTSNIIVKEVSDYFGKDISKRSRDRDIIYMRAIANKLSKELTTETLERIGKYYKANHCTILHSVKKFDYDYIHQTDPFNVKEAYEILKEHIIDLDANVGDYKPKNYNDIVDNYNLIAFKYKMLLNKNRNLEIDLEFYRKENLEYGSFKSVLNDLKKLSDSEMSEFRETRLKPFLNMLESRKLQKRIVEPIGALINR